jgi:hypothetical protein
MEISSGVSTITPLAPYSYLFDPATYDYLLGPDILVCPVTESNITSRAVTFPSGNNWVDWWDSSHVFQGGSTVEYATPLNRFPVFRRVGSMIPFRVNSVELSTVYPDLPSLNNKETDEIILLISQPNLATQSHSSTALRRFHGSSQEFWYTNTYNETRGENILTVVGTRDPDTNFPRHVIVEIEGIHNEFLLRGGHVTNLITDSETIHWVEIETTLQPTSLEKFLVVPRFLSETIGVSWPHTPCDLSICVTEITKHSNNQNKPVSSLVISIPPSQQKQGFSLEIPNTFV